MPVGVTWRKRGLLLKGVPKRIGHLGSTETLCWLWPAVLSITLQLSRLTAGPKSSTAHHGGFSGGNKEAKVGGSLWH